MRPDGHDDHTDGASHGKRLGMGHDEHAAHHEEGEEGEPWLLSYADMVTLLMCFFILFFQVEKQTGKFEEPQKVVRRLNMLIGALTSKEQKQEDAVDAVDPDKAADETPVNDLDVVFSIGASDPNTVEVVMLTSNMFKSGTAELTADGVAVIKTVANQLSTMPSDSILEVEGHTDSEPIKKSAFKSNWELSAARASAVVRVLADTGIPPVRMRATGLAHYQPLVPEHDAQGFAILSNQAMNRRIVIKLRVKPKQAVKDGKDAPKEPAKKKG